MIAIVVKDEELELREPDYYYGVGDLRIRCADTLPWPASDADTVLICGIQIREDGTDIAERTVWVRREVLVAHANRHNRRGDPRA